VVVPEVRFAKSGGVSLAYQDFGVGPVTMVMILPLAQNIEIAWESPHWRSWFERLSSFARVVMFDKRGTGASDRTVPVPSIDARVDDTAAVMDAAGVDRAFLYGISEGGPLAILFAATYPDRVDGLVLESTAACLFPTEIAAVGSLPSVDDVLSSSGWGTERSQGIRNAAPSLAGDAQALAWQPRYERQSASPAAMRDLLEYVRGVDVRALLPDISVPTLVRHRTDDPIVAIQMARDTVAAIPGARLIEQPGHDHWAYAGVGVDSWLQEVRNFIGSGPAATPAADQKPLTGARSVHVLGGFAVFVDGCEVPMSMWRSRRARQLCKRLAVTPGEPISRDHLIEVLWPDAPLGAPLGARLSVQLSTVRRILGGGVIADRSSIRLDPEVVHVDLAALHAAAAAGHYDLTVKIYQGELLPEDIYEDWTTGPRERARLVFGAALRTLLRQAQDAGEHLAVVELGHRLLATDPFDEQAHRAVIAAFAADGRHGEARRAFDIYTASMHELDLPAASFDDILAAPHRHDV
jgi:pimeloyl-ACP methyl ester carboxylesterase/DNA-binding SARP family transcriptional activator